MQQELNTVSIDGHIDLSREITSKSIINTNVNKLKEAQAAKRKRMYEQEKLLALENEIRELKNLVSEMLGKF